MKLDVWSEETATKAHNETIESCEKFKESGVAELLSTLAAGRNARLIVELWTPDGHTDTSVTIGLAVAARNTGARHVCIVPEERSKAQYIKALEDIGVSALPQEVIVEAAEMAVAGLDFLVVDCEVSTLGRVLRAVKMCPLGAVFAMKNARQRDYSNWRVVIDSGMNVIKSVFLPVEKGLDIAYIVTRVATPTASKPIPCLVHWKDPQSGQVHVLIV